MRAVSAAARESEHELLRRLRAGDERTFEQIVRAWHPMLVRLARRFVPTDAIAEEVAQEAWVGLLDGLDSFQERSSLRTWLTRILINRAISRGTRERRSVPDETLQDTIGPFTPAGAWAAPPPAPPEEQLERLQTRAALLAALDELPDRQRAAVLLRDVAGLSGQEVAEALDLSPGNARVLLHRGRGRLRAALEPQWEA